MITAVFNGAGCDDGQRIYGLTQWDYGQYLLIIGLELSKAEVHFAVGGCDKAIIQPAEIRGDRSIYVRIPDKLLEMGATITAYVYVADANAGETVKTIILPVDKRPKPDDYDSPGEKNLLRQLMEKVDKKADGLQLIDDQLQLFSGDDPIGEPAGPIGGSGGSGGTVDIESITNPEIDEIMKGE